MATALYAGIEPGCFTRIGWVILKSILIAVFGFFAVLVLERVG